MPLMATAFAPVQPVTTTRLHSNKIPVSSTNLQAAVADLDIVASVVGQEDLQAAVAEDLDTVASVVQDTVAASAVVVQENLKALNPADLDTSIPGLNTLIPDLDTIAMVVGQENYGLAIVLLGEAIWSFAQAPSVDHGLKTLVPATVAAVVLCVVSGPMVTSGVPESVSTGLLIATAVSVAMGGAYLARCLAPFSPSSKEIPAAGVLVAVAGFFSFSQNLVVDGFVTLPTLPTIDLPSFPTIELPF
jgi:hypothetical protein